MSLWDIYIYIYIYKVYTVLSNYIGCFKLGVFPGLLGFGKSCIYATSRLREASVVRIGIRVSGFKQGFQEVMQAFKAAFGSDAGSGRVA